MVYYLNNVRRKGQGGREYNHLDKNKFPTYIIASSDVHSRYVFRSDIAYDYNVTLNKIDEETKTFKDDHSPEFLRKFERLRFPYSPQSPTKNDTQTVSEYEVELEEFNKRYEYIEGCHTKVTYTALAHYWLLREMINSDYWHFISDKDLTITNAVLRVFSKEVRNGYANYFTCITDKTIKKQEAFRYSNKSITKLRNWAKFNGIEADSLNSLALIKLAEDLEGHNLFEYKVVDGKQYVKKGNNPIEHPLPSINEGKRLINCVTNLSHLSNFELAKLLVKVNNHSINSFFNQVRRRLSILERPLVTARGESKSYIYSNYNPKYVQYAITILRTFHNFCWEITDKNNDKFTPAQRIGIAEKKYDYKDIIYFK